MLDWTYHLVPLRDGRVSEVLVCGDQPRALVWFSGTPGGAVPHDAFAEQAHERGLRLVLPIRPGYGRSTPNPGRRIVDFVDDVDQVLQFLGIDDVVCAGGSGGGPNALAMAAALPQCHAAAVLVSPAPRNAEGLDFYEGMALSNQEEWRLADQGEDAVRPWLERAQEELRGRSIEHFIETFDDAVAQVDRDAWLAPDAPPMGPAIQKALENGIEGWLEDDLAMTVLDWGFALTDITTPVTFWTGRLDQFVSWTHTVWMAQQVPGAHLHVHGDEGHVSLKHHHFPEILHDVLRIAGWADR
jgi:pimeloyl-ACP methyl ester carboxylesterase